SPLVHRIEDPNGNNRMPPGGQLTGVQIALIKSWINQGAKSDTTVDFVTEVQPIFKNACYSCHGGNNVKGDFHLDNKSAALKGGKIGKDIVPGASRDSLLLHRVLGDNGMARMPMVGSALSTEQVAVLQRWIDQGARWPDAAASSTHWAYSKPVRPDLPAVNNSSWPK